MKLPFPKEMVRSNEKKVAQMSQEQVSSTEKRLIESPLQATLAPANMFFNTNPKIAWESQPTPGFHSPKKQQIADEAPFE